MLSFQLGAYGKALDYLLELGKVFAPFPHTLGVFAKSGSGDDFPQNLTLLQRLFELLERVVPHQVAPLLEVPYSLKSLHVGNPHPERNPLVQLHLTIKHANSFARFDAQLGKYGLGCRFGLGVDTHLYLVSFTHSSNVMHLKYVCNIKRSRSRHQQRLLQ